MNHNISYSPNLTQLILLIEDLQWNSAEDILSSLNHSESEHPITYWAKGKIAENKCDDDRAQEYFERSITFAEEVQDVSAKIRGLDALGQFYCKTKTDPVYGSEFLNKALDLVNIHRIGGRLKITLLLNIGMSCLRLAEYHSAIRYFKEVEQIQSSLEIDFKIESVLFGLGVAFSFLEKFEEGKHYTLQSLKLLEVKNSDPNAIAATYGNLGILHRNTKRYDEAEFYFAKSHELFSKLTIRYGKENNLVEWGVLHKLVGKIGKAKEVFEQIYATGIAPTQAEAGFHLSNIYIEEKNPEKALQLLESVETVVDVKRSRIAQTYTLLGKLFKEQGNFDRAFQMYEKSTGLMLNKG